MEKSNRNLIALFKNLFATAKIPEIPNLWIHIVQKKQDQPTLKSIKNNYIVVKKLKTNMFRGCMPSNLLNKLGDNTLIILDHSFGDNEIGKIMREVFDGEYTSVGNENKRIEWKGKINIVSFSSKLPPQLPSRVILLKI